MPTRKSAGYIRKHPISFGNPALGTYRGSLYTTDQDTTATRPIIENALSVDRVLAVVDVPPEQVPDGVFNLLRSHRPWIDHVRIVISDEPSHDINEDFQKRSSSSLSLSQSLTASAAESAASILAAEQKESSKSLSECNEPLGFGEMPGNDELNTPTRSYAVLLELCSEEAASQLIEDLDGKPYTFLDETQTCKIHHIVALQGKDGVSLMSPFFAPVTKTTKEGVEILPSQPPSESAATSELSQTRANTSSTDLKRGAPQHVSDDYNCAVCLERMDLNQPSYDLTDDNERVCIITTVCNHSFHADCLLQWQDSPCPVCRYDHSGLNEALSQCHICGKTEHNYVCLICGVISCGSGARTAASSLLEGPTSQASFAINQAATNAAPSCVTEDTDASHRLSTSHARQHYDQTFHAYALDTETQHVWDFAGQGYVHRLLQNKEDGKLVEVHDPNHHSQERNLSPGLSQSQEDQVVHRKLEGFASQYYTLLKSQLEQQRIYYEGRLEEVRREYSSKPRKRSGDLVVALRQERNQLSRRVESLNSRMRKTKDDVSFLINMNESLAANKEPLQRQIEAIEKEREQNQRMIASCLPPLQDKVTALMLQLETGFEDGKPAAADTQS